MTYSIAFRAWTEKEKIEPDKPNDWEEENQQEKQNEQEDVNRVLILDTETTNDRFLNLLFGSYRIYDNDALEEEGLFYADDLDNKSKRTLYQYARKHKLNIYSRKRFIHKVFFPEICELGTLLICFNAPFDISRLAIKAVPSRKSWRDGFTFTLSPYHERIKIKALNSKAAFNQLAPFKRKGDKNGKK